MRYHVLTSCCLLLLCVTPGTQASAQIAKTTPQQTAKPIRFPGARKFEKTVSSYLGNLTDREETDLISRQDISDLFDELEDIGWEVSDSREIEERLLSDSDWLVRTLRTKKGTRFMREIAAFPGGYDRLDRMQQLPYGKKELVGLINTPGGSELIEYLTTTKAGRNTGSRLAASRGSRKFNEATERLYTKADVYKQFKASYAAEINRRAQAVTITTRSSTRTKLAPSSKRPLSPKPPTPVETSSPDED